MTTAMRTGFAEVLQAHLDAIGAPEDLPVLVCGMAGARQGWVEAGYIDVPASLSSVLDGAVRVPGQARDVRILPGLAQRDKNAPDVMRGEETQLLGALASSDTGEKLVCMPGTHSKWVTVRDGDVNGFATFMTGELFEVISKQTILSHAVAEAEPFTGQHEDFRAAVLDIYANPQLASNRLFTLRSGQLLHGLGLEIAGAHSTARRETPVVLIGSGALGALYEGAFTALDIHYTVIDADEAVRRGLLAAATAIWP